MKNLLFTTLLLFGCREKLPFQELPIGGDAELTSMHGRREKLSQSFGPATLLFFGFTHCPDFCPTLLHKLKAMLDKESSLAEKTRLIFIGVDVARDTPAALKAFLAPYPFAHGYSGNEAEIRALEKAFGAHSEIAQKSVSHSLYLYLLSSNGKVQFLLRHDDANAKIRQAIEQAING